MIILERMWIIMFGRSLMSLSLHVVNELQKHVGYHTLVL